MDFFSDDRKSQFVFLFLLIVGIALVQARQQSVSGVTSSEIQPADARGVKGACALKDIVTVFTEIDDIGCSSSNNSAENLYHYLIIVQNRCKYCNAKGVGIEVSGYFLGDVTLNLLRPFAPGGDQYVFKYTNSKQVGGVSPAFATFYECRDF